MKLFAIKHQKQTCKHKCNRITFVERMVLELAFQPHHLHPIRELDPGPSAPLPPHPNLCLRHDWLPKKNTSMSIQMQAMFSNTCNQKMQSCNQKNAVRNMQSCNNKNVLMKMQSETCNHAIRKMQSCNNKNVIMKMQSETCNHAIKNMQSEQRNKNT